MNEKIPLDTILALYGKACLRVELLTQQVSALTAALEKALETQAASEESGEVTGGPGSFAEPKPET